MKKPTSEKCHRSIDLVVTDAAVSGDILQATVEQLVRGKVTRPKALLCGPLSLDEKNC